ncbi:MAG: sugar phosphate isomerase/epimerase [Candidatus Marinimicrobia bacterium]|nr:sugar phosphate isomerase/epimerase [Candidatus Neomarinimicrobiota bacterium]
MMKLSMMSYTVSRQKEHFDLKKMLDVTAELNMDGIDFVTLHDTDPHTLRKMADDRSLPVVCHTFHAPLNFSTAAERAAGVAAARAGIAAAVVLGAPVVMIPATAKPGKPREASRRDWIAGLREVAPLAADAGVTLTVENFPGENSAFVTAADVLEAVRSVPGLKLTYDNGNAATGEEPAQSFRDCAPHVVHAHFKDWLRRDDEAEGWRKMLDGKYYRAALIGEGCLDHAACLTAMKEAGYDGYINIEYEGDTYTPYEGVRRAVEYLRTLT